MGQRWRVSRPEHPPQLPVKPDPWWGVPAADPCAIRVARQKVGAAHSLAKRATLNFFCSRASQKAPEPPESEPHTIRLTPACRASKL